MKWSLPANAGIGSTGLKLLRRRTVYWCRVAGFLDIETFSFDTPAIYTHAAWWGRIRASVGVAAALPPEQVAQFDAKLAHLLMERFPEEPLAVPHRVFAVVCRAP